jgi:predicted phage tail protein
LSVRSRIGRRSEQLAAEERSRRLARLVGPPLIAISASEAVNLDVVREQYRFDSYLDGSVVFVAGLSLVHGHNRWSSGWPVVLTLTGWAAMLGGLVRMFAPRAETGQAGPSSYAGIAVPFGVGVFLTVKGYARGSHGA